MARPAGPGGGKKQCVRSQREVKKIAKNGERFSWGNGPKGEIDEKKKIIKAEAQKGEIKIQAQSHKRRGLQRAFSSSETILSSFEEIVQQRSRRVRSLQRSRFLRLLPRNPRGKDQHSLRSHSWGQETNPIDDRDAENERKRSPICRLRWHGQGSSLHCHRKDRHPGSGSGKKKPIERGQKIMWNRTYSLPLLKYSRTVSIRQRRRLPYEIAWGRIPW